MKFTQEKALVHLTGSPDMNSLKMETIEKMVHEYPYFSPAQYLFAAKLKKDDHPLVGMQASKTALYFTNPYWLQFQLEALVDPGVDQAPKKELDTALLRSIRKKDKEWDEMINLPMIEESLEQVSQSFTAPVLPNPDIAVPTIESVRELMRGIDPITQKGTIIPVIRDEPSAPQELNTSLLLPKPENIFSPVFSTIANAMPSNLEQEYSAEDKSATRELPDQEKSDAKIASILSSQLAEFRKPIDEQTKLEIEPLKEKLHTIDYFASQGIQIDLSAIPQDKLTTKLRRFTDWLKDMKNHNPNPVDLGTSVESEKAAAVNALVSNESKEILTETMAEVLVKQGQIDKAIQLFIKLSFSNPEKTAYFADKIQQLKGI